MCPPTQNEGKVRRRWQLSKLTRMYVQKEALYNIDHLACVKILVVGFPGGAVVENLPANAGDTGSSPGLGRSHMPRSN